MQRYMSAGTGGGPACSWSEMGLLFVERGLSVQIIPAWSFQTYLWNTLSHNCLGFSASFSGDESPAEFSCFQAINLLETGICFLKSWIFAPGHVKFALLNCSVSTAENICSRLMIQHKHGFPALIAWRSLHTGLESEARCEEKRSDGGQPKDIESTWLQLSYHSVLSVSLGLLTTLYPCCWLTAPFLTY